jgi:hypothetical protein
MAANVCHINNFIALRVYENRKFKLGRHGSECHLWITLNWHIKFDILNTILKLMRCNPSDLYYHDGKSYCLWLHQSACTDLDPQRNGSLRTSAADFVRLIYATKLPVPSLLPGLRRSKWIYYACSSLQSPTGSYGVSIDCSTSLSVLRALESRI